MIMYVSFDLDGTLASEDIDKKIWHEEIPKLYAETNKISLEEAKTRVYAEYFRGLWLEKIPRWTSITYWFDRLGLKNPQDMVARIRNFVYVYPDTIETLEYLKNKYKLIIISNAEEQFLRQKIYAENLNTYFRHIFSGATDFQLTKSDPELFKRILSKLGIQPGSIIHVGNEKNSDYVVPTSVGIRSFMVNREKECTEDYILSSLTDLKRIL